MGAEVSQQQTEISVVPWVYGFFASQQWNGFEIDSSLERFSGSNSVAELNRYRDEVLFSGGMAESARIVKTLSGPLGGIGAIPKSAGLVALVISIILENVAKNMGKQTMGTADLLRRVFAEEKANEVRDLMDEYIKQLRINLRDQAALIESTKRLQSQLSTQLTRLKNSIVKDNQITMSARLLNQWMNGAAFHTQMVIHLERLEETDGTKANTVAGIYQQQAGILLDKYKSHLKENLEAKLFIAPFWEPGCCLYYKGGQMKCVFSYTVGFQWYSFRDVDICGTEGGVDKVISQIMSSPQIAWARTYFSNLQANIPTLIGQRDSFTLQIQ